MTGDRTSHSTIQLFCSILWFVKVLMLNVLPNKIATETLSTFQLCSVIGPPYSASNGFRPQSPGVSFNSLSVAKFQVNLGKYVNVIKLARNVEGLTWISWCEICFLYWAKRPRNLCIDSGREESGSYRMLLASCLIHKRLVFKERALKLRFAVELIITEKTPWTAHFLLLL